MNSGSKLFRQRVTIRGQVQGVGFRPYIYRIALETGVTGFVGNDSNGVFIEVEGSEPALEAFHEKRRNELPPLARITSEKITHIAATGSESFTIESSQSGNSRQADISPDTATCADCLAEIMDVSDRRYRYAFTNCTNCGPRYSIIKDVPYDRPRTTMASFPMCAACQAEYNDPLNRRFHAQPNACPECGPQLSLVDADNTPVPGDPLSKTARLLEAGKIVAIKGIGGFHLACRADSASSVADLRSRKNREAKPLALMVRDLEMAMSICQVSESEAETLQSGARPIVLLKKHRETSIAEEAAPGLEELGIMLPYTPLHHLLLAECDLPLIMTSGNPSDEPLCHDNEEALERLAGIADYFLLHNRDIEHPVDDSVVVVPPGEEKQELIPLRRARGFAPSPIQMPGEIDSSVLALGGEMKSAVCLLKDGKAILSEHLGELDNPAAFRNFTAKTHTFLSFFDGKPAAIAADMHPGYAATRFAPGFGLPVIHVQHHHAHIASCMAEHGFTEPVIGIAADGTGYGEDGTIWGCEVLVCDFHTYRRAGHLQPFALPGGDGAAKAAWRPALGLIHALSKDQRLARTNHLFKAVSSDELEAAEYLISSGRAVTTSSLGRLFDAAAFLAGICSFNRYEAEAAIMLEQAARRQSAGELPDALIEVNPDTGLPQLSVGPVFSEIFGGGAAGPAHFAARFHEYLVRGFAAFAIRIRGETGINTVALSGGCFLNRILLCKTSGLLLEHGFDVLTHRLVPPGDGGLALGQAVIAEKKCREWQS